MRRCIQKSNRTFSGKAQARLTFKIDAIRWIAGHLWEEHNDPDPSVVKTQPGAVGRTGRAFKEGVHGKGGGADHEEDENATTRMKMRKSSNFSEMIFSYLQGSWALWVQSGVMIARQSGLTRVRGREKQAFWMLHLVVSDGGKGERVVLTCRQTWQRCRQARCRQSGLRAPPRATPRWCCPCSCWWGPRFQGCSCWESESVKLVDFCLSNLLNMYSL